MRPSLQRRLLVATALGTGLVLIASGIILHELVRSSLWAQFDRSLMDKANMLAAAVEVEGGEVTLDEELGGLPEFTRAARPEYFELRRPDGLRIAASRSLGEAGLADLPTSTAAPPSEETAFLRLPDGRRGRLARMSVVPRTEDAAASAGEPAKPVVLALARETAEVDQTLAKLRLFLLVVGAGGLLACLGALHLAVRGGLRPLRRLAGQIEGLKHVGPSGRIPSEGTMVEMSPVVGQLNDLLKQLEAGFHREKAFTADVAHELRTPLSGLRAALEVTADRPRAAEHYAAVVDDCLGIVLRMQALVENLLSLARLEAGQLRPTLSEVDLPALVDECWQPLEAAARQRRLRVSFADGAKAEVRTDPALMRLVVRNLLENVVSHADDGGWASVEVRAGNGEATIEVRNSGCDLSAEQVRQVFDRFWRKDSSRTGAGRHCGLGLSLVHKAISVLGGSAQACIEADRAFVIRVCLPLSPPIHAGSNDGIGSRI